jgi:hypothetical protein
VVSLVTEENPSFFRPSGSLLIRVRSAGTPPAGVWPHAHAVPPAQAEGGVEQLEQCVGELLEGLMGRGPGAAGGAKDTEVLLAQRAQLGKQVR